MKQMIDACQRFFELPEEEKKEFHTKNLLDPIKCGTNFNIAIEKVRLWRDYLKVISHPKFNSLYKPARYSEVSLEFSKRTRAGPSKSPLTFKGNPAAVYLLEEERDDQWLQAGAAEFNLSETCYLTRLTESDSTPQFGRR
ncbi:hypothetical protein FF1_002798 [Malus domestica]